VEVAAGSQAATVGRKRPRPRRRIVCKASGLAAVPEVAAGSVRDRAGSRRRGSGKPCQLAARRLILSVFGFAVRFSFSVRSSTLPATSQQFKASRARFGFGLYLLSFVFLYLHCTWNAYAMHTHTMCIPSATSPPCRASSEAVSDRLPPRRRIMEAASRVSRRRAAGFA
jgi:hypothetical protein